MRSLTLSRQANATTTTTADPSPAGRTMTTRLKPAKGLPRRGPSWRSTSSTAAAVVAVHMTFLRRLVDGDPQARRGRSQSRDWGWKGGSMNGDGADCRDMYMYDECADEIFSRPRNFFPSATQEFRSNSRSTIEEAGEVASVPLGVGISSDFQWGRHGGLQRRNADRLSYMYLLLCAYGVCAYAGHRGT
jgi:hypothetical protein